MTASDELCCLNSKHLLERLSCLYDVYYHASVYRILILYSSLSIFPRQHPDLPSPVLHTLTDVSTSLTHLLSTGSVPLTGQHSLARSLERSMQVQDREVCTCVLVLKYVVVL